MNRTATTTTDGGWTVLRTFMVAVGLFLLGGTIWLIISDTYTAANIKNACFNTTELCCQHWDSGREEAEFIGTQFALYWAQLQTDPDQFKDAFADLFAHDGVMSTVNGNFKGEASIIDGLQYWLNNTGDSAITVSIERFFWDAEKRELSIVWIWAANNEGFYTQDQYTVIIFDCEFKVVYYRGYFDPEQTESTYTDQYARPCSTCPRLEHKHHRSHRHGHHRPHTPTHTPTQSPVGGGK